MSCSSISRDRPEYVELSYREYADAGLMRMPFAVLDSDLVGDRLSCCYPFDSATTFHECASWGGDAGCSPDCGTSWTRPKAFQDVLLAQVRAIRRAS